MKRSIYTLLLVTALLGLSGCGKSKKSENIRSGRCSRGACSQGDANAHGGGGENSGQSTDPTGSTQWGQIHKGSFTQQQFYAGVQGFVSANINPYKTPSDLGYVSGDQNADTGIWFWGKVRTATGTFNPNGGQAANFDLKSAELRIVVWDELAGTADSNGVVIPEYPVHVIGASTGSVAANKEVKIVFKDEVGTITMTGTFDNSYFTGYVTYDNNQFWDGEYHFGTYGRAGTLGYFTVPTCGFFNCQ